MSSHRTSIFGWLKRHKLDVAIVLILMAIGGIVSGHNMAGYPERFEDEGTYVSQAWAIEEHGTLTHYTYWYDHPPVGWIQIAAYFIGTDALHRYGSAITAGREFMLLLHIATIGLLYALARRMRIRKIAAIFGVLLYALSPLAVEFSRYVFLDNVALPWLLGAFLLALSPRRSFGTAILAAVCMAVAILSKETFVALLPVILYCLWREGDKRNRRYTMAAFLVVFVFISAFYVLYAALKNELLPGPHHVSLLGSLYWQLFQRAGSGSIFDRSSGTYGLVTFWLHIDNCLLILGLAGTVIALIKRTLRPAGFAMLIGLGLLLRTGYLPFPYVIIVLPFAAICAAGALDECISFASSKHWLPLRWGVWAMIAETAVAIALLVVPAWQNELHTFTTVDADASSRQTVDWVTKNVPHRSRLVVESALWSDLEDKGFDLPQPVWLYKTETDPAVKADIGGWQGIDYVILNGPTVDAPSFDTSFPTVSAAVHHSTLQAEFGKDTQQVRVYKVHKY